MQPGRFPAATGAKSNVYVLFFLFKYVF